MSKVRFSWRGALKSPVPVHEPVHLPEMSVPFAAGAGDPGGAGVTGAGIAVAAGVGVPVAVGESVTVASAAVVPAAGTPVLSVAPAAVPVGGVSASDAGGSDELKTEHAASRGIIASTSSTRIEPPLTQPAFTLASGTSRARLETPVQATLRREDCAGGARITPKLVSALAKLDDPRPAASTPGCGRSGEGRRPATGSWRSAPLSSRSSSRWRDSRGSGG